MDGRSRRCEQLAKHAVVARRMAVKRAGCSFSWTSLWRKLPEPPERADLGLSSDGVVFHACKLQYQAKESGIKDLRVGLDYISR